MLLAFKNILRNIILVYFLLPSENEVMVYFLHPLNFYPLSLKLFSAESEKVSIFIFSKKVFKRNVMKCRANFTYNNIFTTYCQYSNNIDSKLKH